MFDNILEFAQPNPTHFNSQSSSLSKIDRILSTLPPSLSTKLRLPADVVSAPETLHYRKVSDHAPVFLCIGLRDPQAAFRCCLPKIWVTGPIFEERVNFLIGIVQLPIPADFRAVACHKDLHKRRRFLHSRFIELPRFLWKRESAAHPGKSYSSGLE